MPDQALDVACVIVVRALRRVMTECCVAVDALRPGPVGVLARIVNRVDIEIMLRARESEPHRRAIARAREVQQAGRWQIVFVVVPEWTALDVAARAVVA